MYKHSLSYNPELSMPHELADAGGGGAKFSAVHIF
jgi:hypothetical protein